MKRLLTTIFITTLFMCLYFGAAQADVMDMRSVGHEPPNSSQGVPRPKAGMSMDQVSSRFGEPNNKVGAVGDPPISRWVYDHYTVYFEHNLVLHAVVHHK